MNINIAMLQLLPGKTTAENQKKGMEACRRAKDNWSGHEVGFMPQRMPLKRLTTSATFIPSTNRAMP